MAVTINNRLIQSTAIASQTVFTYDFPIDAQTSIVIKKTTASTGAVSTLTYSTDYTLTGVGDENGGTFVLTSGAIAGDIYTAYGVTPEARNSDFTGRTEITTSAINTQYDSLTKQTQQLRRDVDASLHFPITDSSLSSSDTVLPSIDNRKGKYLFFNATTGLPEASAGTSDTSPAGGSNTQIQYNNNDSLAGDSGFTTNGSGSINITGDLDVDNINLNGNAITTTSGSLTITPTTGITDFSGSTQAIDVPKGTTAQRPSSPIAGYLRFNTTTSHLETYNGSSWITQSGGNGDVVGPGTSTDNAVARYNGTGGTSIQDSGVLIDDSNNITGANNFEFSNGKGIVDENGNEQIIFNTTASAVNQVEVTNSSTGSGVEISSAGGDTNIDLKLTPKGDGNLVLDGMNWPIADGSSGQVLQTNGSGILSFENGGAWKLIASATASSSATVEFTGLSSSYFDYRIIINALIPATDETALWMRTDSDGGASYDSGASDYIYAGYQANTSGEVIGYGSTGASQLLLATQIGSTSNEHAQCIIDIINPSEATRYCTIKWSTAFNSGTGAFFNQNGVGQRVSPIVDAIQFRMSSGNIASGNFKLYGLTSS